MRPANWFSPAIWLTLGIAIGTLLVLPHLGDAIWQDESYTLLNFSSRGFYYPFTVYPIPNNHVLLSALLSQWWSPGDAVPHLRFPFLLAYMATLGTLGWAAYRSFGTLAAIACVLLFAGSTIATSFAVQLRGYGLSWLSVALMLWALPAYAVHRRWRHILIYNAAAWVLLALIPTNLIVYAVCASWGCVLVWQNSLPALEKIKQSLTIVMGPLFGLFAYMHIWQQILEASGHAYSDWERWDAYAEFARVFLSDWWLCLPLFFWGIYRLCADANGERTARAGLALLVALVVIPLLFLFGAKQPLFPRSLVTLLPIVCVIAGLLASRALRQQDDASHRGLIVLVLLAAGSLWMRSMGMGCTAASDVSRPGNLCEQYYQQNYHPAAIASFIIDHSFGHPLIVSSYEAMFALGFLDTNYRLELDLQDSNSYLAASKGAVLPLPWIVTSGNEQLSDFSSRLGLNARFYRQALDTGYFRLYQPVANSS